MEGELQEGRRCHGCCWQQADCTGLDTQSASSVPLEPVQGSQEIALTDMRGAVSGCETASQEDNMK